MTYTFSFRRKYTVQSLKPISRPPLPPIYLIRFNVQMRGLDTKGNPQTWTEGSSKLH